MRNMEKAKSKKEKDSLRELTKLVRQSCVQIATEPALACQELEWLEKLLTAELLDVRKAWEEENQDETDSGGEEQFRENLSKLAQGPTSWKKRREEMVNILKTVIMDIIVSFVVNNGNQFPTQEEKLEVDRALSRILVFKVKPKKTLRVSEQPKVGKLEEDKDPPELTKKPTGDTVPNKKPKKKTLKEKVFEDY